MLYIVHHTDPDGYAAAAVIYFTYGYTSSQAMCSCIPYGYGKSAPSYIAGLKGVKKDDTVYFVDLSLTEDMYNLICKMVQKGVKVIHIDHHESGIKLLETLKKKVAKKLEQSLNNHYRTFMNKDYSGCMLCWMYTCMTPDQQEHPEDVPIDSVTWNRFKFDDEDKYFHNIPEAISLINDHDLWKHENERTRPFILGLSILDMADIMGSSNKDNYSIWKGIIFGDGREVENVLFRGRHIMEYQTSQNAKIMKNAFEVVLDGVTMIAVNSIFGNSDIFGDAYNKYDAVIKFGYDGVDQRWVYTIYSKDDSPVQCNKIAEKRGGGGHVHAAGFRTKTMILKRKDKLAK